MAAALVLLDMQRGILKGPIKFEEPDLPDKALAAAERLLAAAREKKLLVVHVGVVRPHARGSFDALRTVGSRKTGKASRDVLALGAGTPDVEFLLAPAAGEEVIQKIGVSAFTGTRLDQLLRNAGVSEVLVGGAFTHMVVESTVRDGFDLGHRMVVVQDACCAPAAAPHNNSLATGIPNFALVVDSSAASQRIRAGSEIGA